MFVQRVDVVGRDGESSALEAALCAVRERVFASPGFRGFSVLQGVDDPARYGVEVRWESAEELAAHHDSGRFERCWAPIEPFLARALRVEHLVERPGLAFQGPGVVPDLSFLADDLRGGAVR